MQILAFETSAKAASVALVQDGKLLAASALPAADRLVVDGCVLVFCQTQVWRRADPARCPPVAAP